MTFFKCETFKDRKKLKIGLKNNMEPNFELGYVLRLVQKMARHTKFNYAISHLGKICDHSVID